MARTFTKNTSNYLSLGLNGVNSLVSGSSAISFASWVKWASVTGADNSDRLFNEYTATNNSGLLVATSTAGKVRVGGRSQSADGLNAFNGATSITTGVWMHIGVVWNFGSPNITLYFNGVSDGSTTPTFGTSTYSPANAASHCLIGGFSGSGSTPPDTTTQVNGDIAEWSVWNVALSAGEMAALAAGTVARRVRPSGLVSCYTLWGDGSAEPNRCGGTPVGTINGSLPNASHPPVIMFGSLPDAAPYSAAAPPASAFPYHLFRRRAV